jgi:hypothetical protein
MIRIFILDPERGTPLGRWFRILAPTLLLVCELRFCVLLLFLSVGIVLIIAFGRASPLSEKETQPEREWV